MKVVFAAGIEEVADEMDLWWRANRPKAPNLFAEELAFACASIAEQPNRYAVYKTTRRGIVRRTLMPGTRTHVYYVHQDGEDVVYIVSVWGGPRGHGPYLR